MGELKYLLTILAEECGEVQDAIHNSLPLSDLTIEMRDVIAVVDLINKNGGLGVQLPMALNWSERVHEDNREAAKTELFECANKIQYYIFKGFRFGFDDIRPGYDKNNAEELVALSERYVYAIRAFSNSFNRPTSFSLREVFDAKGILAKQEKIKFWMQHSISKGLLTIDGGINEK